MIEKSLQEKLSDWVRKTWVPAFVYHIYTPYKQQLIDAAREITNA